MSGSSRQLIDPLEIRCEILTMHAASQLPGKGPTDMDDAPAPAC